MNPIALLRAMRPKQWTKNLLVFAPLLFGRKIGDLDSLALATAAFALFCILSGAVYLINDVVDINQDREHPRKRKRPIASGQISPFAAITAAVIMAPLSIVGCFLINSNTGVVAITYFSLTLAYHFSLKHIVILDALVVATGFVLRVVVGTAAISVEMSPWILLCTLLLALFLSFAKRRQEIVLLEDDAHTTRKILADYSPELLDQMIAIVTASTLISYCLYTISDRTVAELGSRDLLFTIPFVIYGIFRYLYLIHRHGQGDAPDQVLLNDIPLLLTVVIYTIVTLIILYMAGGGLCGPLLPAHQ